MTIAKMYRLQNANLKALPESAGPAVVVGASFGEDAREVELWGSPGIWTMPPDDTHGAFIPMGGNRFGAVVATHHYKTPRPTLAKGETALGSTSSDGLLVKAKAIARADGTWEINSATDFATLWTALNTALQTYNTAVKAHLAAAGDPASGTLTLDISAAKATTIKMGT
jgi:phage gp45-like